jgi:hypothetical protein
MVCYHVSEMLPTDMTTEMQIGHPTLLLGYYPQPPGVWNSCEKYQNSIKCY